ncbi:hypothetical protein P153DRAFT_362933 [Dothidotthia symphoricarpi CBS 119687]|uniref:Uncharacterized protein n=1 Tax=Dothidotthia symphoricarpi CBS 119687 TaxID=1392245 RepID=A0A6A6ARR1_9PLEO|nr:uncharacterized protein P153DRAFT_362933 [Dothidotthia symphoricarpi CBS 119687]KAF2133893.1 hypothetical protein P153DRAFT_362933 [Dothidotthia symphoricarpi CBS 119687]
MSRPQSLPDFSDLMDPSMPLFEPNRQPRRQTSPERATLMGRAAGRRKQPSMSLAAGLIMNSEGPNGPLKSPRKKTTENGSPKMERSVKEEETEGGGTLFYAYALKSDYANSPPSILTFASAAICTKWWNLVQREYSSASRPSPQLFVLKSEDLSNIDDDSKFANLRNLWFCTAQDNTDGPTSIIPLQSIDGTPVGSAFASQVSAEKSAASNDAIDALTAKLDKLATIVVDNAEHINALSVAQSAGLQRMQQFNESTSTQIKSLADTQAKLQQLVDKNASHYIALSNSTFRNQDQIKDTFTSATTQIKNLVGNQSQMVKTCGEMMRSIESLSTSVTHLDTSVQRNQSCEFISEDMFSAMAKRIAPPPRKLNKRIKGVWYEYDPEFTTVRREIETPAVPSTPKTPKKLNASLTDTPAKRPGTPRKLTGADTPVKTPKKA